MASWILTWNPKKYTWEDVEDAIAQTRSHKGFETNWSCAGTKSIEKGDRLYLLRQGSQRGLVASGTATSEPYTAEAWNPDDGAGREQNYIDLIFDYVLPAERVLSITGLEEMVPTNFWNRVQASGIRVKDPKTLEEVWKNHLKAVGRAN